MTAEDMKPLYAAGWEDDAIYLAITVCALFDFYNRWVDASGVHALSDEAHRVAHTIAFRRPRSFHTAGHWKSMACLLSS